MRFQLSAAVSVGANRYRAGVKVADTIGNAQAGDKVVPELCTGAFPFKGMIALDSAALAALAAQGISTSIGQVITPVTGVSSIDA